MEGAAVKETTTIMKRLLTTNIFIVVLGITALLLGYNYVRRPFLVEPKTESVTEQASPSAEVVDAATARIQKLSTKAKLAQLLVVQLALETTNSGTQSAQLNGVVYSPAVAESLRQLNPGIVLLVGAHTATASAETIVDSLTKTDQDKWPIVLAVNQANARALARSQSFAVPQSHAKACQSDVTTAGQAWQKVAQAWQQLGVALVFGPVVDLPQPGTISSGLGCQSATQSLELAKEYIVSFGQYGIMPVIAHFPGLGAAKRSPQKTSQVAHVELQDLEPFQEVLQTYPNIGVLTSTLVVKDQFANQPCSLSSECLAQFPKKHPNALLIADQITEQFAAANDLTMVTAIRQAILAGNHFVVLDEQLSLDEIDVVTNQLTELYAVDQQFAEKVDATIQKIETIKQPRHIDKPANGAIVPSLKNGE